MARRSSKLAAVGSILAMSAYCSPWAIPLAHSGSISLDAVLASQEYTYGSNYLVPVSNSFEATSFYGQLSGQPGPVNTFQGTEQFDVYNASGKIGTVDALVSHGLDPNNNLQVMVTDVVSGTAGTTSGDVPNVGSVFNWAWYGSLPGNFTNVYSSLAGENPVTSPGVGNVISDTGAGNLWGVWPTSTFINEFDATSHIDVHNALVNPTDFTLPNGDYVIAAPSDPESYTAVTNTAPWAVAVQGVQTFEIHRPDGRLLGTFEGNTISTADIAGGHSFEIQVLGDQEMANGSVLSLGSGAGQLPPDGSVFNMLYLFSPDAYNVYTDYAGTGSNGSNEINLMWNLFGTQFDTSPGFDAVNNLTDGHTLLDTSIPLGSTGLSMEHLAGSDITYTGINGMPNGGLSGMSSDVQSNQEFTISGSNGDEYNFWANVMSYADSKGVQSETLYLNPATFDGSSSAGMENSDIPSWLSSELSPGSEVSYTTGSWWNTMAIDPTAGGLHPDAAGDAVQMISIPLLGGAWTEVDPSSDFWLSLMGITF